jgi:sortase A
VDELSPEELETLLEARRRIERARRFGDDKRASAKPALKSTPTRWRERLLFILEIGAVVGLGALIVGSLVNLDTLNQAVAQARKSGVENLAPSPVATVELPASPFPPVDANVTELPGSSFPPADEAPPQLGLSIKKNAFALRALPTPGPQSPTRIVIPAIKIDSPVVPGDDWEALKQGVGHRLGTPNPGERGNMILSGHNDVYGEVFKELEFLELNEEVLLYAGSRLYRYVIRARRIVAPTDLSPLNPSREPIVTLITCWPYRVDTYRLILVGELVP